MSRLHPQIARIANRYKTRSAGPTHEFHDLRSLASRVYLSQEEVLQQVESGSLLALSGPINGKYLFSAVALSNLRNRVIDFVSVQIATQLAERGYDLDRIEMAVQRGLTRQHELSRGRGENIEFDQGDNGSFVNGVGTGVGIAAGGLGAYGAYRYWKGRRNPNGTPMLPGPNDSGPGGNDDGSGPQSAPVPGGGGPRPRDPNSSAVGVDVGSSGNGRHPGPPVGASLPAKITTQSPRTLGGSVIDPLSQAVAAGKRTIARRGSAIWAALKNLPIE